MARIYSYGTAKEYLDGGRNKTERKIPSIKATKVILMPDGRIDITHYDVHIITYFSDGSVVYNCRGYRSKTTKDRLNDYGPWNVHIYQQNWQWYVTTVDGTVPYEDGMMFNIKGGFPHIIKGMLIHG